MEMTLTDRLLRKTTTMALHIIMMKMCCPTKERSLQLPMIGIFLDKLTIKNGKMMKLITSTSNQPRKSPISKKIMKIKTNQLSTKAP
jgi:hypothetical protein